MVEGVLGGGWTHLLFWHKRVIQLRHSSQSGCRPSVCVLWSLQHPPSQTQCVCTACFKHGSIYVCCMVSTLGSVHHCFHSPYSWIHMAVQTSKNKLINQCFSVSKCVILFCTAILSDTYLSLFVWWWNILLVLKMQIVLRGELFWESLEGLISLFFFSHGFVDIYLLL